MERELSGWSRDMGDGNFQLNRVFHCSMTSSQIVEKNKLTLAYTAVGFGIICCQEIRQRTGLHLSGQCLDRNHQITQNSTMECPSCHPAQNSVHVFEQNNSPFEVQPWMDWMVVWRASGARINGSVSQDYEAHFVLLSCRSTVNAAQRRVHISGLCWFHPMH